MLQLRPALISIGLICLAAGLALCAPSLASATTGPVAAYGFGETTGTAAGDSSGFGNTGTLNGAVWSSSGKNGGALSFNGSNARVDVPDSASLRLASGMTLEAWVRPSSTRKLWRTAVLKERTSNVAYGLYATSNTGKPAGVVDASGQKQASGPATPAAGTWTHLATTYDGTVLALYVNGQLVSSTVAAGPMGPTDGTLRIGGNARLGQWFSGLIDDVRVYDRALPASEINRDLATPVAQVDTTAPTTPAGLKVTTATATSISLSWNTSTDNVGVAGYDVFNGSTQVASPSTTSYTVSGLSCGQTYALAVDAFDAAGNRSGKTTVSTSTTACNDTTPPSVPQGMSQSSTTQSSFTWSWSAASDNSGVAGYALFRDGVKVGTTTGLSYTYTGLACGTTYTIMLEAYDVAGNYSDGTYAKGPSSTSACTGDTTAPSTPSGLTANPAQSSVSLSWSPSTDNTGVTGYGIYRDSASAGTTTGTSTTVSGLTCGTSYVFGVDAYDAAGNRSAKATVSATTAACSAPTDTQAPTSPTGLAATPGSTSVALTWASSSDNVGVTGYGVYRNGTSTGTAAGTSYTVGGLTCGTSYTFAVDAFDAAGNRSARSTTLTATTTACSSGTGTANLWVDPNGGSCTRAATAGGWNDAQGCSSLQAAVAACTPGDKIMMKAGSYGSQSISASKTAPGCTVDAETGTSIGSLSTTGNWLTIKNVAVSSGWTINDVGPGLPNNITLDNVAISGRVFIDGGDKISMIGGKACCTTSSGSPGGVMLQGDPNTLSNVLFDGVDFRDHRKSEPTSDHYEVIRIQDHVNGVTVRNSWFHNNSVDTSTIFLSQTLSGVPTNINVEGNYFDNPSANPWGISNPAYVTIDSNLSGGSCTNWTFGYNTFLGTPMGTFNNCAKSNMVWRANIGPKSSGSCAGSSFLYNVWQAGSSVNCPGGTDRTVGSLGLTGDGFHLSSTSPARGAGDPSSCPSSDRDGNARSMPSGSTCDAGADETN